MHKDIHFWLLLLILHATDTIPDFLRDRNFIYPTAVDQSFTNFISNLVD